MSKRYYFPNQKIIDERFPFDIQLTSGLTVYYSEKGKDQLRKADTLFSKKTGKLNISIGDYNIILHGYDENKNIVYDVKYKGELLKKENEDDTTSNNRTANS